MIEVTSTGWGGRLAIVAICCALPLLLASAGNCAAAPALSAAAQETLRQGERIYREGILPSGEPLLTSAAGGTSVPGTSYACVSCHLRSGLGSLEGGILTPPAAGVKLFKPLQVYSSAATKARLSTSPQLRSYQVVQRRPKYSDQSLARALRNGVDSAGRTMNDYMPRYPLDDRSMAALIAYLKSLSAEFSPGVSTDAPRATPWKTETTLHLATIVGEEVSVAEQTALLMPLNNFIRNKNMDKSRLHGDIAPGERAPDYGSRLALEGDSPSQLTQAPLKLSLSRWVLKGAPESWRAQLEQYYRKEPVFAIVGGVVKGDWQPVHQFCEENRIPCIFPMTDFPVVSSTDWYTLYFSKGYYQEGEGAAHFLNEESELQGKPIVQVVRDSREGRALSEGFLKTWRDLGQRAPVTVTLKPGETLGAELLRQTLSREKPGALLLWDGPESAATLELVAGEQSRPPLVLASASFLGQSMFSLPEKVRGFTYLTYPYRISLTPEERSHLPRQSGQSSMALRDYRVRVEENTVAAKRISQQAYILTMTLHMALDDLRGNYYRDNLLDVIGTFMKQEVRLYERLTFAPGQRYASRGCYIVQLAEQGLVKKSDLLSY